MPRRKKANPKTKPAETLRPATVEPVLSPAPAGRADSVPGCAGPTNGAASAADGKIGAAGASDEPTMDRGEEELAHVAEEAAADLAEMEQYVKAAGGQTVTLESGMKMAQHGAFRPQEQPLAEPAGASDEEPPVECIDWRDAVPVLAYQDEWIKDNSKLKVAVWSRQSGKSFAAALRAVLKCLEKRTQYIILSKGERQSRMFMEKVRDFCDVFRKLKTLPQYEETQTADETTMEVYFPHNGSRIIGLPANPDTARGYSGNIVLDEFAFHGDAQRIYAACFPIITRGYSIEVISTPNGTAGKFYEIAKDAGLVGDGVGAADAGAVLEPPLPSADRIWSGHKVDIFSAVAAGLPADIGLLRSGCDDEETWLQEYCCQFLSDAQNYIPIEMISRCVHEEATTEWGEVQGPKSEVRSLGSDGRTSDAGHRTSDLYLGIDIGRKHDFTIAWLFEKVGPVLWSRVLLTLKGVAFDEQERQICNLIETGGLGGANQALTPDARHLTPLVHRCSVDQSGIGMMLAERLVQKYGAVVEPVTFTAQVKERLAPMVKQAFEECNVRIPDNREVRADINSVKRMVTPAGNVRFDAEHTDRGHADRFWALAQVINAASQPTGHFDEVATLTGRPLMAGLMGVVL